MKETGRKPRSSILYSVRGNGKENRREEMKRRNFLKAMLAENNQ